jgi:1,4-dihydroxy-2-naphthoate octaprenyltransferase
MTEHSLARPRPSRVDRALLWVRGARPRTLFISLAPILVGFAQASTLTDNLAVLPVFAAAIAALAIQIATNLANDAADGARGGDGPGRLGPERLTGAGLMPAATVAAGALAATLVAVLFGAVAIWHGGWPILAIGVAALLAGWGYSYGPRPISASPLGEVFVVLFFGVAAVVGTVWLGAGRVDATTLVLGVAIGLPAAAVLTANNHRDRIEDARNGRRTLAILIGEKRTVALYKALGPKDLQGELTLVHLWASWCGSCRTEFPAIDALQNDMRGEGLRVAAVSLDRLGWPAIDRTIAALDIHHVSVFHDLNRELAGVLKVAGLPTTIVLDRSGQEVGRLIGAGDWADAKLRDQLRALMRR